MTPRTVGDIRVRPIRRRPLVVALVVALIGIPLAQASGGALLSRAARADSDDLSSTSYIDARARLLGTLPDDPVEAARALSADVLGPDEGVAQVATIELLRQAGIPTINIDGAVVAMPSDIVLGNAPMDRRVPPQPDEVRARGQLLHHR